MRRTITLILSLFALVPPFHAGAQSLYIAPNDTESERLRRLLTPFSLRPLTLEMRAAGRGDTNVLALSEGDRRHAPRRAFHGEDAYFTAFRSSDLAFSRGAWELRYAWSLADLYRGNRDAGQLYLDSLADTFDPQSTRNPMATMNRSSLSRWQAAYTTPIKMTSGQGSVRVAGNYLRLQRAQFGSLSGNAVGEQFNGALTIQSTRDLPPSETRSHGFSLDLSVNLALTEQWRIGFTCENLFSRVWMRTLQQIEADVKTNTIQADPDGFLFGAPLLSGRISRRSLQSELRRRLECGFAYRQNRRDWLLFVRNDFDWRAAVGASERVGQSGRWWALFWLDPFEWQTGYDAGPWRIQFGLSTLDPESARRAALSIAWVIPLERRREK
jgi:hypothetical protein